MADFSQPGSDGDFSVSFEPSGFAEWPRGVVYTVRPEMLAPLAPEVERRIGVFIRRRIEKGEPFTRYADLYERAVAIVKQRVAELTSADSSCLPHSWTAAQAWGRFEGRVDFLYMLVTTGVVCLHAGDARPRGEAAPTAEALLARGGLTEEVIAALKPNQAKHVDEIYNDFDFDNSTGGGAYMFSYGEYVPSRDGLDFAPIVERAERRACSHAAKTPVSIVRREWYSTSAPDLAVVHVYFGK